MTLLAKQPWGTSADGSGRQRTMNRGPKKRIQGVSIRVDLANYLDQIVELETEAYKQMGGVTKKSLSDVVEEAVEDFVAAYMKKNGPLPLNDAERRAYVKKLAEKNQAELRQSVLAKAAQG
jgi:hypothetical protein